MIGGSASCANRQAHPPIGFRPCRGGPMRSGAFALTTVVVLVALAGPPSQLAAQKTGRANVLLVDDETGDPVQGATIKLKGRDSSYMTDQNGRVLMADVPTGKIELQVRAIGFFPRNDYLNVVADQT